MSDTSIADSRAGLSSREALRGVTGAWWLFLILGILWILFGMFVLSYNVGSLLALAVFAGVTFLMTGINQLLAAGRVQGWGWLYLVGGALSIIAGIVALVWPGRTLVVFVNLVGIYAIFYGFTELFAAFDLRGLGHRLDRVPEQPAM